MNHPVYIFLWSLWRSHCRALATIWLLSIAGTGAWWYAENETLLFLDEGLMLALMYLLWTTGIALLCSEETVSGLGLAYPAQRFALPLSTGKQVAVVLAYRTIIALLHTLICIPLNEFVYFGGRTTTEFAPLFMGAVLLVFSVQWAAFLNCRYEAPRAIGTVLGAVGGLLCIAWLATGGLELGGSRASWAFGLAAVPTLFFCIRGAGVARTGGNARQMPMYFRVNRSGVQTGRRESMQTKPPWSPLRAQTWLEFRSTAVWFPALFLPAFLLAIAPGVATPDMHVEAWDLGGLSSLVAGIAFATGYLWDRRNRVTTRFSLGLPLDETTCGSARALAGMASVLVALLGVGVILIMAMVVGGRWNTWTLAPREGMAIFGSMAIASAPYWWVALCAGRIIALAVLPAVLLIAGISTLTSFAPVEIIITPPFVTLAATIFALSLWSSRRCGTPTAWPLSLVVLLAIPPILWYDSDEVVVFLELFLLHVIPTLAALALLYHAYRASFFSRATTGGLFLAFLLLFGLFRILLPLQVYNVGLAAPDSEGYLVALIMLPIVWLPHLARLQRAG
ncbi:MAG: hypothetical protein KF886_02030 [Candidatus Hydrogenedentes bacterium]|nr:hypothetical protein [Candidatus Hydrogenedentota bacterium]